MSIVLLFRRRMGTKMFITNRISVLLSFVGLSIAGALSLAALLKTEIQCGDKGGCSVILASPASKFLGQPVAYYGFFAYLLIAALAIFRALKGSPNHFAATTMGSIVAGLGTVVSLVLTTYGYVELNAFCTWCLGSAATMTLLLITHMVLLFSDTVTDPKRKRFDFVWIPVLFVLASGAIAYEHNHLAGVIASKQIKKEELEKITLAELAPAKANAVGPKNGKIAVVEFYDLCCPACRDAFPAIQKLTQKYPKVRFVFRHLPLASHKNAKPAATICEMAAERGKFWPFYSYIYTMGQHLDPNDVMVVWRGLFSIDKKIDGKGIKKYTARLKDAEDPAAKRVESDMAFCKKYNITRTPTFIIMGQGMKPEVVGLGQIAKVLDQPQYRKLMR